MPVVNENYVFMLHLNCDGVNCSNIARINLPWKADTYNVLRLAGWKICSDKKTFCPKCVKFADCTEENITDLFTSSPDHKSD